MNKKIAFIGCGNMGGAILDGILSTQLMKNEEIIVCVNSENSKKTIASNKNVEVTTNMEEAIHEASTILLAIKPNLFEELLSKHYQVLQDKLIVSVAAGISMEQIASYLQNETQKIIRIMPNTPACVKEAMSSLSVNEYVSNDEKEEIKKIFASFGKVIEVEEEKIHAVIAISGSSPAYVFMLLDAMIKNGMKHGLSKEQAYTMASQAVLGSAKMVLDTKENPNQLKQNVCSPNGTTIEAVQSLESDNFYEILDKAMDACFHKSEKMSGK